MPNPKETPTPTYVTDSMEDFARGLRDGSIKRVSKTEVTEGTVSLAEAQELMGPELFRGPEQVEQVFGFRPEALPIPFTKQELERAKELGQKLRRRVSRNPEGTPLSAINMNAILAPNFEARQSGAVALYLPQGDWKRGEPCWETEAPKDEWVLTDDELAPGTIDQDFFQETDMLIARLKEEAFKSLPLPAIYQTAIAEYEAQKEELQTLASDNTKWQESAKRLSELAITRLLRPIVSELCQDLFSEYVLTGTRLLPTFYSRTRSLSRDGFLVHVGYFDAKGVYGGFWKPLSRFGNVGASFSRSPR